MSPLNIKWEGEERKTDGPFGNGIFSEVRRSATKLHATWNFAVLSPTPLVLIDRFKTRVDCWPIVFWNRQQSLFKTFEYWLYLSVCVQASIHTWCHIDPGQVCLTCYCQPATNRRCHWRSLSSPNIASIWRNSLNNFAKQQPFIDTIH